MIPPKIPTAIIKVRLLFDSSGRGASPKSSELVSSKDIKHSPGYFVVSYFLLFQTLLTEYYKNDPDIIPQLQGLREAQ